MLDVKQHMRPSGEEVAAKVIDGEAIIINLATGFYYSMDKVGGVIWNMIEQKSSLEKMVAAIVERYEVSREQAETDIELLVQDLQRENLISFCEDGVESVGGADPGPESREPYEAPKLNIYKDMGDLLALDPPTPGIGESAWNNQDKEPSD